MSTLAESQPGIPTLFDGREGKIAPFKADYVSSLVSSVLNAEINQILQKKALSDPKDEMKDVLEKIIKAFKDKSKFPYKAFDEKVYKASELKIGIVGGGIAGLYAAYILTYLEIDYEILEANHERLGGRVYTHYFSKQNPPNHDYYDVGAMRFPDSPIMARTFDLFRRLEMGDPEKPWKEGDVLIPYYLDGQNCPTRYNDITAYLDQWDVERKRVPDSTKDPKEDRIKRPKSTKEDPFKVSTANGGTVPATRVSKEATREILSDAYGRFRQKIRAAQVLTEEAKTVDQRQKAKEARQHAYEYLMRHDKFSLRDYLQNIEGYDPETVHWIETTDSASGWFDQAFTENVFESLAFEYNDSSEKDEPENKNKVEGEKFEADKKEGAEKKIEWWCIEGGTSITIKRLLEKLDKTKIHKGKVVTKLELLDLEEYPDRKLNPVIATMRDHSTGAEERREYSAVINTTTLGALQKIDLTGMELPYGMKTAIRVLRYDTSTKVGIRFKEMWWMNKEFDICLGGVAKTDLPIRVCVYPSYNIYDKKTGPGVLLASYTWGQDSERIAAHVSTESPEKDKGLKELMIYNLARLHTINREGEGKKEYEARFEANKKVIADNWDTHHAFDWSKDEFSAGAFALFSPGQFSTLIPHLVRPASDGRFVIVGEHASANHAWIVGALDSSLRGLKQILTRFGMETELNKMIDEFQDVDELNQEQVAQQVIISKLSESQMAQLKLGRPVRAVAQVQQT